MKKTIFVLTFILTALGITFSQGHAQDVFQRYLELFFAREYQQAGALQSQQLKEAFGVQAMKQSHEQIIEQYGEPQMEYSTQSVEQQGYQVFIRIVKTTKGFIRLTVSVDKENKIAGFFVAPAPDPRKKVAYIKEADFEEKVVKFGKEGWELDAVLAIPNHKASYPVIILVGGSGPTDMNGTIGANTPYKDIAQGLASSGIGVLRYNKRTAQYPSRIADALSEDKSLLEVEYIEDIIEAIKFVSEYKEADAIILAGHSLGGTLVPQVAANSEAVDGLILLAPGVRRLAQISLDQNRYVKEYANITDDQMAQVEAFFNMILNHELPEDYPIQSGMTAGYYYECDNYRPIDDLEQYRKPVLVLQGEEDFQVTMADDFIPLREAFGQRDSFTFVSFEALNHLFIKTEKDVFHWTDEYDKPGFVDDDLIMTIVDWVEGAF